MIIGGRYFDDYTRSRMMDEEKLQLDVLARDFRKEPGILGQDMILEDIHNLFDQVIRIEEDKKPMTKEEKRKASRERRKAKKEGAEEEKTETVLDPFNQTFFSKEGKEINLRDLINPDTDVYRRDKRRKEGRKMVSETRWLLTRDAVQKIADIGGIVSTQKVKVIDPVIDNNYLIAFDVEVTDSEGKKTSMIGEASDENTRGISQMYKVLTAERRGYQRAVLRHFRLSNIFGEDEFVTEDEIAPDVNEMDADTGFDKPTHQEFKEIAPLLNEMTTSKTKEDLEKVGATVKAKMKDYSERQIAFLRRFYEKALLKFEETI